MGGGGREYALKVEGPGPVCCVTGLVWRRAVRRVGVGCKVVGCLVWLSMAWNLD